MGALTMKPLSGTATILLMAMSAGGAGAAAPPPVTALAYRPDGQQLAVAQRGEVALIDPATGAVTARIPGQSGQVTALAWSRDGGRLAVASGAPGKAGEVR